MTLEKVRIPAAIEQQLNELAHVSGVSVEQFVIDAVTTKVSQMTAWRQLLQRTGKVTREEFLDALSQAPNVPPLSGDELPEGWTPSART